MADAPSTPCDCADTSCCGDAASPRSVWRTLVFLVVVIAAVGVAAHSLLTRGNGPGRSQEATIPQDLAELGGVSAALADHDVVLVVLPAIEEDSSEALRPAVDAATAKIATKSLRAATLTLSREELEFVEAADAFAVEAFPAVVVLRQGCGRAVASGETTEASLLLAYAQACAPACGQ